MKFVSVIMPVFNAESYLAEAIESILTQIHHHLELVIVDDGSNDGSIQIVTEAARQDSRIKFFQEKHGGACRARNRAMSEATGEWIVAMDADDISLPHRIEKLLFHAERQPEVVLWGSYYRRIGPSGKLIGDLEIGPLTMDEFDAIDRCQQNIPIINPTAMFRRDIALALGGYDENLAAAQDSEFWDRMVEFGPALVIGEYLLLYRLHRNTISYERQALQKFLQGYPMARNRAKALGRTIELQDYLSGFDSANAKPTSLFKKLEDFSRRQFKECFICYSEGRIIRASYHLIAGIVANPLFTHDRIRWYIFKKK